jgi:hypothetical protein
MAKFVLKTAVISLNSVDLSDHFDEVTIETEFDEVETTSFGDTYKTFLQGLGDATITLKSFQDFASGEIDATLWPLSQSGASFPVAIKPTNGAISATNPEYQMTGSLFTYNPIDGKVGEASRTDVVIRNASSAGLVRDTTP